MISFSILGRRANWQEFGDADAYVLISNENDAYGIIGIAWVGGTCSSSRYIRTSITEFFRNEVHSLRVF